MLEALRIDPPFVGAYRECYIPLRRPFLTNCVAVGEASAAASVGTQSLKSGDKIFVNIGKANLDVSASFHPIAVSSAELCLQPDVFQDPTSINVARAPRERYLIGDGSAKALGLDLSSKVRAPTAPPQIDV